MQSIAKWQVLGATFLDVQVRGATRWSVGLQGVALRSPHGGGWTLHDFACTLRSVTTESDPMDAVRAEMKRRREELGLSPTEAGHLAGITGQWWRCLEAGSYVREGNEMPARITRKRLIRIARGLRWDVNEALAMAAGQPLSRREAEQNIVINELARIAAVLPAPQQRLLLLLAKSMLDPMTPVQALAVAGLVHIDEIPADEHSVDNNHTSSDGDGKGAQ